jgi:hypothetical protein
MLLFMLMTIQHTKCVYQFVHQISKRVCLLFCSHYTFFHQHIFWTESHLPKSLVILLSSYFLSYHKPFAKRKTTFEYLHIHKKVYYRCKFSWKSLLFIQCWVFYLMLGLIFLAPNGGLDIMFKSYQVDTGGSFCRGKPAGVQSWPFTSNQCWS